MALFSGKMRLKSAVGVPGILELTKALDFHIAATFKPGLHSCALGFTGLGGIHSLGDDAATIICDVALAIQAVSLDAIFNEGVQELFALGGGYVALVIKRKFKAEFLVA